MIFASNQSDVDDIHEYLLLKGIDAVAIHGALDQSVRVRSIQEFKSGEKDVLVATDVASKGLDFPDIQHVINYDMPKVAFRNSSRSAGGTQLQRRVSVHRSDPSLMLFFPLAFVVCLFSLLNRKSKTTCTELDEQEDAERWAQQPQEHLEWRARKAAAGSWLSFSGGLLTLSLSCFCSFVSDCRLESRLLSSIENVTRRRCWI